MGKTLSQRATEAAREVQADPVRFVDRVFFVFGTLASAWLAFLLIHKALTAGWRELWYLIPFWLTVTYLLLPRIHTLLSRIYLPDYFIGRTRTREGVLGDPVNVAFRGSGNQIHTAMVKAGWKLADELDIRTGFRIVTHTLRQKTYPDAPVSSLYLFGTRHAFPYQQEVEGNPRKRHHVRFWPIPQGWLLPGGTHVDWLAAGTYDRSVGLSLFTGQVTHRIEAEVDRERDHIVATLTQANPVIEVEVLENFSSGYHHRNGGGDRIQTDGDLPIVNVECIDVEHQVVDRLPPASPPSATGDRVPLAVGFGTLMMMLRVVLGFIFVGGFVNQNPNSLVESPLFDWIFPQVPGSAQQFSFAVATLLVLFLIIYLFFAIGTYREWAW